MLRCSLAPGARLGLASARGRPSRRGAGGGRVPRALPHDHRLSRAPNHSAAVLTPKSARARRRVNRRDENQGVARRDRRRRVGGRCGPVRRTLTSGRLVARIGAGFTGVESGSANRGRGAALDRPHLLAGEEQSGGRLAPRTGRRSSRVQRRGRSSAGLRGGRRTPARNRALASRCSARRAIDLVVRAWGAADATRMLAPDLIDDAGFGALTRSATRSARPTSRACSSWASPNRNPARLFRAAPHLRIRAQGVQSRWNRHDTRLFSARRGRTL